MKFAKRFNTVFHRLIFSYALLIILTTLFMGAVSYFYYSKHFNEEVRKAHGVMLEHVGAAFEKQVFDRITKVHVELTANQRNLEHTLLFFHKPVKLQHAKILEAQQYLQYLVSSSDGLIHSIDVYYRSNRMLISSTRGYQAAANDEVWEPMQWLDSLDFRAGNFYWMDRAPRLIGGLGDSSYMTLVASYPYQGQPGLGYVVIHADAKAALALLQSSSEEYSSSLIVLGPEVYHTQSQGNVELPDEVTDRLRSTASPSGISMEEINNQAYMLSYHAFRVPGWKLVSLAPVEDFYRKSDAVQQMLLVLGLVSIGLGLVVSNVFTNQIYHPLRSLLERTKELFREGTGAAAARKQANEYVQINQLIDNLSVKVSSLEDTLTANRPLVKQSLVNALLQDSLRTPEELGEYLELLGIPYTPAYCAALHFHFHEETMGSLNLENGQFLLYHFMERLESENSQKLFGLAVKTSEFGVGAVVFADEPLQEELLEKVQYLQGYTYAYFMLGVTAGVGSWQRVPLGGASYQEAVKLLERKYLFPRLELFAEQAAVDAGDEGSSLDYSWQHGLMRALKGGDPALLEKLCTELLAHMQSGSCSVEAARQITAESYHTFKQYLYDTHLDRDEVLAGQLADAAGRWEHVEQWANWMQEAAGRSFALLKDRSSNRSLQVIDQVKEYVCSNLDVDLSLNAVAEQVSLNPAYLSRMFKSATGWSYVDYVTGERMKKAKELLLASDENIERIALSVGYFNPAYFTKKFKETYGMTPSEYRTRQLLDGVG